MKNLSIDVLRSFVTVAEFGSFTQSSELLARSQPAISMQIKKLEKNLNHPLFQRTEQKLALTDEGRVLYDYAIKILSLNDEAITAIVKPELRGQIKFGIPSEFATTLLPKIVARFSKDYPTVSLDVSCDLSVKLLSPKRQREFDLILALVDDPKQQQSERLLVDDLVWVTKDKHNAHLQNPLPIIAAPDGCIYRKRALEKLNALGIPWRIIYTIPDLSGIQSAIEEGLGVTVLAKSVVPSNLQIIKTNSSFPRLGKIAIQLINNADNTNTAVTRLMEYLKISLN